MKIDYSKICGYSVGMPVDSDKEIKYVLAGNGAMEIRENEIAIFSSMAKKVPGLDEIPEGIQFKLPKIPMSLLFQIIAFFKAVNELHNSEALVQIYWDRGEKTYSCFCPYQTVSGASVDFKRDKKKDKDFLLVADIHSHNTMDAFFSATDDADEKEARFYGVMGLINDFMPKMLFRCSTGRGFADIAIEDIFDFSMEYPSFWLKRVRKGAKMVEHFAGLEKTADGYLPGLDWRDQIGVRNVPMPLEKTAREWDDINIEELRESLLANLSDDKKDYLATELWGSLRQTWEGIDNGGYNKIGE